MKHSSMIAATAIIAAMAFSVPTAFGKAHDQGIADGKFCPICGSTDPQNARDQINTLTDAGVLDGNGVSAAQKDGIRGSKSNDGQKAGGINCIPTGSSLPCPAAQ